LRHYIDTAVIVAALTVEPGTAKAQAWIAAQPTGDLLISDWVIAEFSSALSIKLRTGQIDSQRRAAGLAAFNRFCSNKFAVLPVTSAHFRTAAIFADHHDLGLRAGDALHLAIASEHGATLCSFDRRLIDAGPALAIPTVTP
jgi:predicted nucleic acid-binding protein